MAPDDSEHDDKEAGKRFTDFDCPTCDANNPYDDGFGDGDEVRCYYCGADFRVKVSDGGAAAPGDVSLLLIGPPGPI